MGGTELLVALVKVAAVLVLLIGALRLLGRYQRGGGARSNGRAMRARPSVLEIVDQTRLGRTSSVVAVRAGERVMVLGGGEAEPEATEAPAEEISAEESPAEEAAAEEAPAEEAPAEEEAKA